MNQNSKKQPKISLTEGTESTQRISIPSVNLCALCEKRIVSSPLEGEEEAARPAVAPTPEPRKSQRRSMKQGGAKKNARTRPRIPLPVNSDDQNA